jgi:hypothetical protein
MYSAFIEGQNYSSATKEMFPSKIESHEIVS